MSKSSKVKESLTVRTASSKLSTITSTTCTEVNVTPSKFDSNEHKTSHGKHDSTPFLEHNQHSANSTGVVAKPCSNNPLRDKPPAPSANMSKLSQGLKSLINAPFAKPNYTVPNASTLKPVLQNLASDAQKHSVGIPAWLTLATATSMTMNAPNAMILAWNQAQQSDRSLSPVTTAELQREVGLKCISFNGIPRTINCLGAFYNALPQDVRSKLSKKPTREFSTSNIEDRKSDGLSLWDSVYYGFERKLLDKLGQSHPDLPVHIISGHYASLLSNPSRHTYIDGEEKPKETHVGRVLTSLVAIACLRAQTGVGPQVVSHVFGLRKAYERGDAEKEGEVKVQGGEWLSGEEGNKWMLEWIDELVKGIGTAQEGEQQNVQGGTTFAPGMEKANL